MVLTWFKPWRRYAELDGLSDAECMELVERSWYRYTPPWRLLSIWAMVAGALCAAASPFVVNQMWVAISSVDVRKAGWWPELTALSVSVFGLGAIAGGVLGGWVAWLLIEQVVIARTVRRVIAGAVCPKCRQSLRGLPIYDDATRPEDQSRMRVTCPECGKVVRLLKHGYSPADLAAWEDRVLPKDFEVRKR